MQFDLIIVGGGMVGAALASALRACDITIALVDATPLPPVDDPRLIALNYGSVCLLKNLKAWPDIALHAAAIEEVHVSHQHHFGVTRLLANEMRLPTLGQVVPASIITKALYRQLDHITLIRPATLKNLTQTECHATLSLETPQGIKEITGKTIIGADGTHSTVRALLNVPIKKIDYRQSALVTITELQRSHRHIAYERFLAEGALAMLPLTGERAATIWTAPDSTISALMQLSDQAFLDHLQQQFGYRLGRLVKTHKRFVFPLTFIQAEQQVKQRVVLLGNAAHTLHPIAAQGLNLAFYEIAILTDYFLKHKLDNLSLLNFGTQQQKVSMRLSHQLNWLFSQDALIMKTARQMGMLGLDLCPSLKKYFMRQTTGQTKDTPWLLKNTDNTVSM